MRRFADLYAALDASTSTEAKVAALVHYLGSTPPADAAWGVYFLAGGKPRQTVPTALLRAEATALAGIPDWLFEASYQAVGDLAETIAQVLPPPQQHSDLGLADWLTQRLLPLRGQPPQQQVLALHQWWDELPAEQRFLLVKLIGGGFRVGVSKLLVQRALARHAGLDAKLVAQRMMGWTDARQAPSAERLAALLAPPPAPGEAAALGLDGQPYPVLPGPCAGRRRARPTGRAPGPGGRLAGGMEVRRHPRPAGAARWPAVDLVTRRGTDHRPLPRSGRPGRRPARRHSAGRRTAGLGRGRPAGAIPGAAAAHPAQDAQPPIAGCGAGALHRLRPAGAGRARPAHAAAGATAQRAAGPAGRPAAGLVAPGRTPATGPAWRRCGSKAGPAVWKA